jgi:biotin transporter BioY
MKRLQGTLLKLMGSIGRMKVRGLPRALVIILMLLIIGSILLYLSGWVWLWAFQGKVDLPAMNMLIQTLTGVSFIAAIGFIGKSLVDEDEVPDEWEKKKGEENESIHQPRP